jgi:opacity protein-like surface antigen
MQSPFTDSRQNNFQSKTKIMKTTKILILTSAVLAFSIASFAQQKPATFIGAEGGVSLPLGNFSKASTASSLMSINGTVNDLSGYAKLGGFGALNGAWFFSRYFGIGGLVKYGTYHLKNVDSLSQGYEESFDVDTTRTTTGSYKMWSIMPGLYFDLPLAKKFDLTARALVGIAHASTPNITVSIEDGGVFDQSVIQGSASKTAFAWDLGAGFRYYVTRCLAIDARADFFYTKPDFTIPNSGRNNNAGREVKEYDQPLESVNFSLGIAYQFSHKK